ncbi:hypothetical protein NDU88_005772 [Pleurodeles waltl]|uniref:Uncharacterized protein n=1 Tax=Pleurodeles waltl TaxID=8319 RepID=A0AAV7NSG9_PLEWA|nr:hypothetical protein NDU88_005772 [Pleurodeles waltl]
MTLVGGSAPQVPKTPKALPHRAFHSTATQRGLMPSPDPVAAVPLYACRSARGPPHGPAAAEAHRWVITILSLDPPQLVNGG